MTRDKSSSDKHRVIMDLSWPKGQSVNSGAELDRYLGTQFVLTSPSVDNITDQILQLGRGCHIFKVDISRTFLINIITRFACLTFDPLGSF